MTARIAMVASNRRELKLHMQSLTDTDIAKVAAFLRVGGERLQCDWKIVPDGELHVLMLGNAEASTVPGMLDSPLATLRVVDAGSHHSDVPGILKRPLQYEAVLDALTEVERKFIGKPVVALSRAVPLALVPSRVPAATGVLARGACFRLRRWPPTEMLRGDRNRQRLASFLSARHLELDELARLSNVDRPQCEEFLTALDAAGMLNVKAMAVTAPAVQVASTAAASLHLRVPAPTAQVGLFSKIRSSLGMTWLR
jgi:hypothetical protein